MGIIMVTPDELRAQAVKVDDAAGEYYNEYAALIREVEELTTTGFQGDDASAFLQKVKNFEKDFNKMKELMNEYADFMRKYANEFDDQVKKNVSLINSQR